MDMRETDLAWLGGIIDGEGNFYMNSKTAKINKVKYLDVKVRVSSTDMRMIKAISKIYVALNLRFHYACVNWKRGNWKRALSINVASQGSTEKLLAAVSPYLVNKKDEATILLKAVNFVKSFPKGGNIVRRDYWDTPEMKKYGEEYEQARRWYFDPSTTTRKASSVFEFGEIV